MICSAIMRFVCTQISQENNVVNGVWGRGPQNLSVNLVKVKGTGQPGSSMAGTCSDDPFLTLLMTISPTVRGDQADVRLRQLLLMFPIAISSLLFCTQGGHNPENQAPVLLPKSHLQAIRPKFVGVHDKRSQVSISKSDSHVRGSCEVLCNITLFSQQPVDVFIILHLKHA